MVAIDAELTRRLREMENQEQRARELIAEARNKSWVLEALASPPQYESDEVRLGARDEPRKAANPVEAAASSLGKAEWHLAQLRWALKAEADARRVLMGLGLVAAGMWLVVQRWRSGPWPRGPTSTGLLCAL